MTSEEHLDYHEDKINRLKDQIAVLQKRIHAITAPSKVLLDIREIVCYVNELQGIEKELAISFNIRSTILNIQNSNPS